MKEKFASAAKAMPISVDTCDTEQMDRLQLTEDCLPLGAEVFLVPNKDRDHIRICILFQLTKPHCLRVFKCFGPQSIVSQKMYTLKVIAW